VLSLLTDSIAVLVLPDVAAATLPSIVAVPAVEDVVVADLMSTL